MFYTYSHATPEGRIFYIGKGQGKRAYSFYRRGSHWNNIVSKYGNPVVKILANWDSEEEAFEHEKVLIACLKNINVVLCNKTDGGEGTSGYKHTPEQIERNRLVHLNQVPWNAGIPCRDETKVKLSAVKKGKPGKPMTEEAKLKISLANTGKKHTDETKAKMSAKLKGRINTEHQRAIASALFKGNNYAAGNTANRTWVWIGKHIETGIEIRLVGEKAMKDAGVQHANIIKCLKGERKSHKGYTWRRELWEDK